MVFTLKSETFTDFEVQKGDSETGQEELDTGAGDGVGEMVKMRGPFLCKVEEEHYVGTL